MLSKGYVIFWSKDVLKLIFIEGLGLASPPYFVYDFSRETFLLLSINAFVPNAPFSTRWKQKSLQFSVFRE